MTRVSENLVNSPALAGILQAPHQRVMVDTDYEVDSSPRSTIRTEQNRQRDRKLVSLGAKLTQLRKRGVCRICGYDRQPISACTWCGDSAAFINE